MREKLLWEGMQPDPGKLAAPKEMPVPKSYSDLHRVLGMMNFLGQFILNKSRKTEALRSLLEEQNAWQWEVEHLREWGHLIEILTHEPVLKFFDPKKVLDVPFDGLPLFHY